MVFGKPNDNKDLKDYVLERINRSTREILDKEIITATDAIETIITDNIDVAMNKFN